MVIGGGYSQAFTPLPKDKPGYFQLFDTCFVASSSSCTVSMKVFQALRTHWRALFNYLSIICDQ